MITGNERQIRYFISTLYLSQLKINNDNYSRWVFVDAMITLIHSNQLNQALSFYNYYDTEVYVYVNTVRFYNGHLIPEIELTNRGLVFYQYLQEFNYEHLNHNFGQITINKDNLVQLTFPYFNNQHNFIYTENDYITLLSQNSSEEEVILQQLSEILDTLSDEFNISIYNRQYLLSQLYNLIIHHYAYGRSFSILFDSYKLIKEKFKRINPEFFDRSHELVKNFALRLIDQYPTENYYELYYGIVDVLYTVWHNLLGQLIIDDRKVDVLIHNSLSPKLCWFIFDVLKTECSYEAQYNIHSSHLPLTEDLVNQYDLVITDEWMNIEDSQKIFHLVHLYKNFTKDVQERLLNIRMSWIQ